MNLDLPIVHQFIINILFFNMKTLIKLQSV